MNNFSWLFSDSEGIAPTFDKTGVDINPANGLPMVDHCHSVDIMGNPFGTNFISQDLFQSHCGSFELGSMNHHDDFHSGTMFLGCGMNDW